MKEEFDYVIERYSIPKMEGAKEVRDFLEKVSKKRFRTPEAAQNSICRNAPDLVVTYDGEMDFDPAYKQWSVYMPVPNRALGSTLMLEHPGSWYRWVATIKEKPHRKKR